MHNENPTFILYFSQMFFAYEAVFIALVNPRHTEILEKINGLLQRVLENAEKKGPTQNTTPTKALKSAIFWARYFPIINDWWRKITTASLVLGILLTTLVYYLHFIKTLPIGDEFCTRVIYVGFSYMFIKLAYYFFQYRKNKKLLRDIELIFTQVVGDEIPAHAILKEL